MERERPSENSENSENKWLALTENPAPTEHAQEQNEKSLDQKLMDFMRQNAQPIAKILLPFIAGMMVSAPKQTEERQTPTSEINIETKAPTPSYNEGGNHFHHMPDLDFVDIPGKALEVGDGDGVADFVTVDNDGDGVADDLEKVDGSDNLNPKEDFYRTSWHLAESGIHQKNQSEQQSPDTEQLPPDSAEEILD